MTRRPRTRIGILAVVVVAGMAWWFCGNALAQSVGQGPADAPAGAAPTEGADAAAMARVRAFEGLGQGGGDEALRKFAAEHLAPSYRKSVAEAELFVLLRAIRLASAGADDVRVQACPQEIRIELRGAREARITFQVEPEAPYKITSLSYEELADAGGGPAEPPLTWDHLEQRLLAAKRAGFSGAVIVVRDGKTIVDRGYGLADRERGTPNSTDTIFGIGSVPIDFTKAGDEVPGGRTSTANAGAVLPAGFEPVCGRRDRSPEGGMS